MKYAIALAVLVVFASQNATAACSKRELRSRDTTTIELVPGVREQPAYYLAYPDQYRVLYFKPVDVVAWIKQKLDATDPSGQRAQRNRYLDLLAPDFPLKEDTDLFKYGLRNMEFAYDIPFLVSSLMDSGRVYVDLAPFRTRDWTSPHDVDPMSIKRVNWAKPGYDGHKYCDMRGVELFSVTDAIYD